MRPACAKRDPVARAPRVEAEIATRHGRREPAAQARKADPDRREANRRDGEDRAVLPRVPPVRVRLDKVLAEQRPNV